MAAVRSDGHSLVERWVGASEALGRGAAENRRDGACGFSLPGTERRCDSALLLYKRQAFTLTATRLLLRFSYRTKKKSAFV